MLHAVVLLTVRKFDVHTIDRANLTLVQPNTFEFYSTSQRSNFDEAQMQMRMMSETQAFMVLHLIYFYLYLILNKLLNILFTSFFISRDNSLVSFHHFVVVVFFFVF